MTSIEKKINHLGELASPNSQSPWESTDSGVVIRILRLSSENIKKVLKIIVAF